jgi:hypothetical protein
MQPGLLQKMRLGHGSYALSHNSNRSRPPPRDLEELLSNFRPILFRMHARIHKAAVRPSIRTAPSSLLNLFLTPS